MGLKSEARASNPPAAQDPARPRAPNVQAKAAASSPFKHSSALGWLPWTERSYA